MQNRYEKLAADLRQAVQIARTVDLDEDGGTCNFDSLELSLPRWPETKVKAAVKAVGLSLVTAGACLAKAPWSGGQTCSAVCLATEGVTMVQYRHHTMEAIVMPDIQYLPLAEWCRRNSKDTSAGRHLIARGKLPEAIKLGRDWLVPFGTPWPQDRRFKE